MPRHLSAHPYESAVTAVNSQHDLYRKSDFLTDILILPYYPTLPTMKKVLNKLKSTYAFDIFLPWNKTRKLPETNIDKSN